VWLVFFGLSPAGYELGAVHRTARLFALRPYAVFPGPASTEHRLFVACSHPPGPRQALVVADVWVTRSRPAELPAQLDAVARALRETAVEAAERLACPAAPVLYLHSFSYPPGLEDARLPGVALVLAGYPYENHPDKFPQLSWSYPGRAGDPSLPPYPFRPVTPLDAEVWKRDLEVARTGLPKQAREASRSTAERALGYLKEAPARCLVEGPQVAATAAYVLEALLPDFGEPPGRRYRLWAAFYLAGVQLTAATFGGPTVGPTQLLRDLLGRWESWSRKERRVIARGAALLAEKVHDRMLPRHDAFAEFLLGLPESWLRQLVKRGDWRLEFESLPLLLALRRLGHPAAEPLLADRFPWALNLL
jgi:hypothetical protein